MTPATEAAIIRAITDGLDGGRLRISSASGHHIVSIPLGSPSFTGARLNGPVSALSTRDGKPAKYVLETPDALVKWARPAAELGLTDPIAAGANVIIEDFHLKVQIRT